MDDNTSNVNQEKGSISHIPFPAISQTEFSDPAGSGEGAKDSTIPENGGGKGSFTATSQQIRGEHHLAEGE